MSNIETYTFAEAAQLTGLTKKALRNRVYRGQLRSVLRDGVRRIPLSELVRAGLIPDTRKRHPANREDVEETGLLQLLVVRLEQQATELGHLRALTQHTTSLQTALDTKTVQINTLTSQLDQQTQTLNELANAGFFQRRHLLQKLKNQN